MTFTLVLTNRFLIKFSLLSLNRRIQNKYDEMHLCECNQMEGKFYLKGLIYPGEKYDI